MQHAARNWKRNWRETQETKQTACFFAERPSASPRRSWPCFARRSDINTAPALQARSRVCFTVTGAYHEKGLCKQALYLSLFLMGQQIQWSSRLPLCFEGPGRYLLEPVAKENCEKTKLVHGSSNKVNAEMFSEKVVLRKFFRFVTSHDDVTERHRKLENL